MDGTPGFGEQPPLPGGLQRPGDTNQDGRTDLSDAVSLLGHLFIGSPERLPCGDGVVADPGNAVLLDLNGDTQIDLADMCGVSAIHANRAVGKLRELGLGEIRRGDLYTSDWDALREYAQFEPDYLYGDGPLRFDQDWL